MKKAFILLFLLALPFIGLRANDGVYYTSGNQLIPITETEISVKKEVLDVTRRNNQIHVHVYYEFFNPGKEKTLLVGFEAMPPGGVWGTTEEEYMTITEHPNIHDFTVVINGQHLGYQVSHVEDRDNYFHDGKFDELTRQQELELGREWEFFEGLPYWFVYHFNATFKEGINVVEHTYVFEESEYVGAEYCFDYVLTAANRWANHQIDDFTLNVDMGERESFAIKPAFFDHLGEWTINGVGRTSAGNDMTNGAPMFHMQRGSVTFHKANFHPEGELSITKVDAGIMLMFGDKTSDEVRETARQQYTRWLTAVFEEGFSLTKEDKRILRNLPFAYRGHVFKNQALKQFFESTNWYMPNPDYVDRLEELSPDEREWVEYWSK